MTFQILLEDKFLDVSSPWGRLFVGVKTGRGYRCLLCCIRRGNRTDYNSKDDLLDHIELEHPELFEYLLKYASTPLKSMVA
ncbi:MAG: hypothetical protein ACE5Z5_09820 [Candidatus Bathyarchaeia archaeon]